MLPLFRRKTFRPSQHKKQRYHLLTRSSQADGCTSLSWTGTRNDVTVVLKDEESPSWLEVSIPRKLFSWKSGNLWPPVKGRCGRPGGKIRGGEEKDYEVRSYMESLRFKQAQNIERKPGMVQFRTEPQQLRIF